MVTKVPLKGLNIRQSRGKWYVSIRKTGETLIKGFKGTRDALDRKMSSHDFRAAHLSAEARDRSPAYADGSLGSLVKWFQTECPRWDGLAEASKADYQKTFDYLEAARHDVVGPVYDFPAHLIDQPGIYQMRNKAAKAKWGRFADKMVSHLSTVFKEAIKEGKGGVTTNPAIGVEKLHSADPNANHEWTQMEVQTAIWLAPDHLLTPIILARYQGFRGQTCAAMTWKNYVNDDETGKAFDLKLRKNDEAAHFPCFMETRRHLDAVEKTSVRVCVTSEGLPWKSEKVLQGAVSDYFTELKKDGLIREGCTLHGLRVTYAAAIRRRGFDTGIVADALGDRSEAMGKHYTRHVEKEAGRMRVFNDANDR
jgi:hypothetical protein